MKKIQPVDHSLKPPQWHCIGNSAGINICRQEVSVIEFFAKHEQFAKSTH